MGKLYRKEEIFGITDLSIERVIDITQDYKSHK